jgi:putative transposase
MPQSLSAVYVHLVFSTKERHPFLKDEAVREYLHRYLGKISKQLGCAPLITGGVEDHVHQLVRLGRTITQAEWVKELKRVSSLWMKNQHDIRLFQWQGGYADFSVSYSDIENVRHYIANQAEHHWKITFEDELRLLLKQHEVAWDERYVWD